MALDEFYTQDGSPAYRPHSTSLVLPEDALKTDEGVRRYIEKLESEEVTVIVVGKEKDEPFLLSPTAPENTAALLSRLGAPAP